MNQEPINTCQFLVVASSPIKHIFIQHSHRLSSRLGACGRQQGTEADPALLGSYQKSLEVRKKHRTVWCHVDILIIWIYKFRLVLGMLSNGWCWSEYFGWLPRFNTSSSFGLFFWALCCTCSFTGWRHFPPLQRSIYRLPSIAHHCWKSSHGKGHQPLSIIISHQINYWWPLFNIINQNSLSMNQTPVCHNHIP